MTKFLRLLVVSLAGLPLLITPEVSAAKLPTGITLSPFLQQVTVSQTDTEQSFSVTVTNHTPTLQEITLSAQDFGSLNDTGGLLIEGSNGYTQKYGLASWLTLSTDTVELPSGESKTVTATIDNRQSLQPGGHYGAIVATIGKLDDESAKEIVINQQLMALVFVTKVGGEHYDLHLNSVKQNGNWLHLPTEVTLRFQNPGNVQVIPRGLVQLTNGRGTVLAQGIINDESAFVLPESFRQLPIELTPVTNTFGWPGTYQVKVQYRYDGINQYAVKTLGVRYVNLPLIAGLVLIALVGFSVYRRFGRRPKTPQKSAEK